MCGLFGGYTIGALQASDLRNIRTLGILSTLRGMDSSGVAAVSRKKNDKFTCNVKRHVGDAVALLNNNEVKQLLHQDRTFLVSGHSRFATNGTVNERNAHPIQEGPLIACHNGMIREFEAPKALEDHTTDSRILIKKIHEKGLEQALSEADNGAYAIAYIDMHKSTLNFVRNVSRPLWFMWNNTRLVLYWSSEKEMLDMLKQRGEGGFLDPTCFEPSTLYSLKMGTYDVKRQKLEIKRIPWSSGYGSYRWENGGWVEKEPKSYPMYPITPQNSMLAAAHQALDTAMKALPAPEKHHAVIDYCLSCQKGVGWCFCQFPKLASEQTTSVPEIIPPTKHTNLVRLKDPRWYKGWKGVVSQAMNFTKFLQNGCVACKEPMVPESKVHWIGETRCVCDKCLKDKFVYEYMRMGPMFPGFLLTGVSQSDKRH